MAEVRTGDPAPPESQPSTNLEILDFQNYGALYGRFLIASIENQADASRASGIIDPTAQIEFNVTNILPLDQRNHNPTFESFSFAERDEQWKEFSYEDAYQSWRTQFTEAINNIKDEKRIGAFQTILPGKAPSDFTPNDADFLFELFSEDKSDVTEFVGVITRKLGHDSKIDPAYLKLLIPHFEWLASGLFGRQTASMVSRLVELESELHNNPNNIISVFSANKDRINTPQDHERRLLGVLHAVNMATIQQPKVASEELEEEDEEELIPPPLNNDQPLAAPAHTTSSRANSAPSVSPQTPQSDQQPKVNTENAPVNSVIEVGRGKMDLKTEFNQKLSQSQNKSETFSAPATTLKDYVITLVDDIEVEYPGKLEMKNNQMYIAGLRLKKSIPFKSFSGSLDLIISTIKNGSIQAEGKIDTESNMFRKKAEEAIKNIHSNIKKRLDKEISYANQRWKSGTISISGDNVLIVFNKTS